jgi:hypothetical protein
MHRREVLKALAALPLGTALGGCKERNDGKQPSNMVEVHLDGAFAVVIQENKANSILAFSPRPKKGDEQHQFFFNGSQKPEDSDKAFHFKLAVERRERELKPEISLGLKDFSFKTERWRVGDSLVVIELPAPDRITFSGHRSAVTFLADHRAAFMPTNHILEYDVKDSMPAKLECSESSLRCEPSRDSFPGVTRFFFEIGPKRSLDFPQSHSHAIDFFNYILHQSFPDLEERFKLAPEYPRDQQRAQAPPRVIPAVFQYGAHGPSLQSVSYAVDCEFAGPLVTTNSGPLKP